MKSFFKKIAKGIKTGFKSIGKAFKKVFKGIGKFVGKLGPIGMLGMMLLFPTLGGWWGQFGKWAGAQSGALGTVMKGIHAAGSFVGKAYKGVTDTIKGTLDFISGPLDIGTGMENFMSEKLDQARDFFGLQTATPLPTGTVDTGEIPDATSTAGTGVEPTVSVDPKVTTLTENTIEGIGGAMGTPPPPSSMLSPTELQAQAYADATGNIGPLSTELPSPQITDSTKVLDDFNKHAAEVRSSITPELDIVSKGTVPKMDAKGNIIGGEFEYSTPAMGDSPSKGIWSNVKDKGAQIIGGLSVLKEGANLLGYGEQEMSGGYGGNTSQFDPNVYLDSIASYQNDYASLGFAGAPDYGPGSRYYVDSVANSTDPLTAYFAYLQSISR
jgi:hypothetical protein|tara:strand:- start:7731 stop:8879 length:1149 start_codon:yes stop_codon:yes gene_type:complete